MLAEDKTSDLALLRTTPAANQAQARLRGGQGLRTGENVTVFGYPLVGLLSDGPKLTTGVVSSLSGPRNDRRLIQITAPVQPGNSGGPLLDQSGRVVGVVVRKLNALAVAEQIGDLPQNINFAISLDTLQSFLDSNGVAYAMDVTTLPRPTDDVAAEARDYTVLIACQQ